MPFPFQLVGPEPQASRDHAGGQPGLVHELPSQPGREIHNLKFRMLCQKPLHILLVLLRRKCACRVDQRASHCCHLRREAKDLSLPAGTQLHVFRAPVRDCLLLFAEHPLP